MLEYTVEELIYHNPLASQKDVDEFIVEGVAAITFPDGRMRMANLRDPAEGQAANFVYWLDRSLPADIEVTWDFWPIAEPGLCIIFFAAAGRNGEDLFAPSLQKRTGEYGQYHRGGINAMHLSYFRRKFPGERVFHTCNLRKSFGFHLVAQGADPLPSVEDAAGPYNMRLVKLTGRVGFWINDLPVLEWTDDGEEYGPVLGGGKIGFRQMAPLVAEYANLKVHAVSAVG